MRSIRLSLVVYFLVLLTVALGVVCVIVYREAEQNLREKQRAMAALFEARHKAQRDSYHAKLDAALLKEARTIGDFVRLQGERPDPKLQTLAAVGGLTAAGLTPNGPGAIPIWWLQLRPPPSKEDRPPDRRGPTAAQVLQGAVGWLTRSTTLKFKDMVIPEHDGQLTQFIQVNSQGSTEWHSASLQGRSLPLDRKPFAGQIVAERFDDLDLDGVRLRRVTIKLTNFPVDFRPPPMPKGGFPKGGFGFRPPGNPLVFQSDSPRPQPTIYIQGAYDRSQHEPALAAMRDELDEDLRRLGNSTQDSLRDLGQSLLLVSAVTFGAALIGVLLLVRLGLVPLQRLSEAVSKVSEKDFRLPLENRRLPAELRPIVERLEQTLDQLKRAFDREKQAAADISHELRTPLAALMTTLEVALRKPRSAAEYREVLEDCRASGEHMHALVERLLTLARIDAGVDRVRPREVDVATLAEQCASLVRPLAEARGLSLRVHRDGPAALTADPDKLREVVTNLLHNAIEYNRPDGAIDLAVTRDNGHVRVEVRDTGIGIPPEQRQRIFERFYRADPSRQAEGLHAGLGLAIVKGYIDLMGGSIDVESTVGQGSTFRVRFPAGAALPRVKNS